MFAAYHLLLMIWTSVGVWQVVGVSRLTKGGWGKIAHHLGRSGSSAVPALKLKYKTLKAQPASPDKPVTQSPVKDILALPGESVHATDQIMGLYCNAHCQTRVTACNMCP